MSRNKKFKGELSSLLSKYKAKLQAINAHPRAGIDLDIEVEFHDGESIELGESFGSSEISQIENCPTEPGLYWFVGYLGKEFFRFPAVVEVLDREGSILFRSHPRGWIVQFGAVSGRFSKKIEPPIEPAY